MQNRPARRITGLLLVVVLTMCLPSVSLARSLRRQARTAGGAYVSGDAAKLTGAHTRKLLALRAPIAVPTYVPDGFRIAGVSARRDTKTSPDYPIIDYAISYVAPGGKSFSINSANEGIGDLFLSKKILKGSNPLLAHPIEVGYLDDDTDGVPEKEIASQWVACAKRFRLRKTPGGEQVYHLRARGITLRDALRIMESLRYLKQ